jgi:hypothetical protein
MVDILRSLEPRFENKGSLLFIRNQNVSEIFFFEKCSVDVGYSYNG